MNNYLFAAGILAIVLGLTHSILGERLVFRQLRAKDDFSWVTDRAILPLRSIRILWATWHLVTVCALGFGVILLKLSVVSNDLSVAIDVENTIAISMSVSSVLVLIGTKGKHPGWIALISISILTWLG